MSNAGPRILQGAREAIGIACGDDPLIPHAALKRRWSRSPVTLWRWAQQPDFPKPAAIINDRKFYRLADIKAYETRGLTLLDTLNRKKVVDSERC